MGSWAKEQITIENLKNHGNYRLFTYMDTKNPGIVALADGYAIGKLNDLKAVVTYARDCEADLVLAATAAPLELGLIDALKEAHIKAFGPDKSAARLENNKAFTRHLLKKYLPRAVPEFRVFSDTEEAKAYAKSMDWRVAVKPLGLTDGLGVRVYGDQLKSENEVAEYIQFIIDEAYSGYNEVIVEELLEGEEFTLQCLVNDTALVPTPAVQDFKKLLPGERGPNTASMGSYSDADHMLPFLGMADYGEAFNIIRSTLEAYKEETGRICCGFLYGQFMVTAKGVKLIEYNIRPGDPEWMNVVYLLEDDLLKGIDAVLRGEETTLRFRNEATVCKYIVPPKYPKKMYQTLDVDFDESLTNVTAVKLYHSCGLDTDGRLAVGTERGLAFLAGANKITLAHKRVERTIRQVQGSFYHRKDIGSAKMLRAKMRHMSKLLSVKDEALEMRTAKEPEYLEVHDLVRRCPPLEVYDAHVYKIMIRYFGKYCYVARKGKRVVGWVMGFPVSANPDTYFLWQIGIDADMQGSGLGTRLLKFVEMDLCEKRCRRIELTIDPENRPSQKLFDKNGYRNRSSTEGSPTTRVNGLEALTDFYSPGRHFMLYEKILNGKGELERAEDLMGGK